MTHHPEPLLPRLLDNERFVASMAENWAVPDREPKLSTGVAASAGAHRAQLSAHYPGRAIVVSAGAAMLRNDDAFFPFRPDSNFVWLTGCNAEDAILVMLPVAGGHDSVLFIPEPFGPGTRGFFADRNHGELWVGPHPGLAEWASSLEIEVRPLARAEEYLAAGVRGTQALAAGRPTDVIPGIPPLSAELLRVLSELRLIKDPWEIAQLREAVDASVTGFRAVAAELDAAADWGGERWLQGTFDRHARTLGNGPGYVSIIAAGPHAPVLHWTRSNGPIRPEDLLLLDAGVELDSFYTADVTRTFPIGGTFSAAQRAVHDLVQSSHEAGLAAVGPGRNFTDFHHASMEVIARGLKDWGLLDVSVDEALSPAGQHHRRYLVCGIGHHLGLDLHDCSHASEAAYQGAEMAPNMVLTVEPGLYFHEHDLTVPPELRGIGVRIEDDVVVTETGSEVLSADLPIDATGLEAWVAAAKR